ncbi:hypothetical protein GWI33_002468 [Rhynchophorus ferrugineus]|uniref:Uncharacterized protein n=1 Tax=Rhynchophorus ferrugineus TaxID=354439 RepID=A0A834IU15_RHYFE|nr:hypothetical protein GWI33_002468 [Rhynchophorus ferrugineus]
MKQRSAAAVAESLKQLDSDISCLLSESWKMLNRRREERENKGTPQFRPPNRGGVSSPSSSSSPLAVDRPVIFLGDPRRFRTLETDRHRALFSNYITATVPYVILLSNK